MALKLAAAEAELIGLRGLLAEVRANRDELREDRDAWREQARELTRRLSATS
jgi:hypothetical protein